MFGAVPAEPVAEELRAVTLSSLEVQGEMQEPLPLAAAVLAELSTAWQAVTERPGISASAEMVVVAEVVRIPEPAGRAVTAALRVAAVEAARAARRPAVPVEPERLANVVFGTARASDRARAARDRREERCLLQIHRSIPQA